MRYWIALLVTVVTIQICDCTVTGYYYPQWGWPQDPGRSFQSQTTEGPDGITRNVQIGGGGGPQIQGGNYVGKGGSINMGDWGGNYQRQSAQAGPNTKVKMTQKAASGVPTVQVQTVKGKPGYAELTQIGSNNPGDIQYQGANGKGHYVQVGNGVQIQGVGGIPDANGVIFGSTWTPAETVERAAEKERKRREKDQQKARERLQIDAERVGDRKERDRAQQEKERERQQKAAEKVRERQEKERERQQKDAEKVRERLEKERERQQKDAEKVRERQEKERDRQQKEAEEARERQEKERDRQQKEAEEARERRQKDAENERERQEKERERQQKDAEEVRERRQKDAEEERERQQKERERQQKDAEEARERRQKDAEEERERREKERERQQNVAEKARKKIEEDAERARNEENGGSWSSGESGLQKIQPGKNMIGNRMNTMGSWGQNVDLNRGPTLVNPSSSRPPNSMYNPQIQSLKSINTNGNVNMAKMGPKNMQNNGRPVRAPVNMDFGGVGYQSSVTSGRGGAFEQTQIGSGPQIQGGNHVTGNSRINLGSWQYGGYPNGRYNPQIQNVRSIYSDGDFNMADIGNYIQSNGITPKPGYPSTRGIRVYY